MGRESVSVGCDMINELEVKGCEVGTGDVETPLVICSLIVEGRDIWP